MNNIDVSNSEIGVLNTGTIENVDCTVTVLKSGGNGELADAVAVFSEEVIKAGELSPNQKNQILELLSSLSEEAVSPKEKRKLSVVRALMSELSGVISEIATLGTAWEKLCVFLDAVFKS